MIGLTSYTRESANGKRRIFQEEGTACTKTFWWEWGWGVHGMVGRIDKAMAESEQRENRREYDVRQPSSTIRGPKILI